MDDWIRFLIASGVVAPWLLVGAWVLAEWAYETLKHRRRMRTDPIYRSVEIRFRAELVQAGLGGRTVPVRSVLWWSSVVTTAGYLSRDTGWLLSMRWLWSMATPLVALEMAAIQAAGVCLNLTAYSFVHRLGARRGRATRWARDDHEDSDDLLRTAEVLSAQYDAIADGDHRRAAALAHRLHTGPDGEDPIGTVRLVRPDHGEPT